MTVIFTLINSALFVTIYVAIFETTFAKRKCIRLWA